MHRLGSACLETAGGFRTIDLRLIEIEDVDEQAERTPLFTEKRIQNTPQSLKS